MHFVHTTRLPALHRFWLIGLAAAMLAGSTLAIAAQAASHGPDHKNTPEKHEKASGHAKESDRAGNGQKHEKAADHAKESDRAGNGQKADKAAGHSKKDSDGASLLKVIKSAAKAQSESQDGE